MRTVAIIVVFRTSWILLTFFPFNFSGFIDIYRYLSLYAWLLLSRLSLSRYRPPTNPPSSASSILSTLIFSPRTRRNHAQCVDPTSRTHFQAATQLVPHGDLPTATLQRIKGLVTGSLPTYQLYLWRGVQCGGRDHTTAAAS